jgi:hypothetical protein
MKPLSPLLNRGRWETRHWLETMKEKSSVAVDYVKGHALQNT